MANKCFTKNCQTSEFNGESFECGEYTVAESRNIRARMFTRSSMLDARKGNTPFINIIPNVTDKVKMRYEDWRGLVGFKSPQETGGIHECRPFQAQKLRAPLSKTTWLHVKPLNMELAFCLPELMPTYLDRLRTQRGFANRWKDRGFTNWIVNDLMLTGARDGLDALITSGDYNSPIKKYSQFDGIRKMLYTWAKEYTPEVVKITLPVLAAGDYVHLAVGGQTASIPFNTDQATTIVDIADWMNTQLLQTANEPLYTVTSNYNDCIYVTEKLKGCGVDVMAFVNQSDTIDWYAQANVCDGIAIVETVESSDDLFTPILDHFGPINKDNFYEWYTCSFLQLLQTINTQYDVSSSQLCIVVSEHMNLIWDLHLSGSDKCCDGKDVGVLRRYGIRRIVDPSLKGFEYYATWAGNIQFGTDLRSDFGRVDTNYDWSCKTLQLRLEGVGGIGIARPNEVITNIPCLDGYNFQPIQPDISYQFPCKAACDNNKCVCVGGFQMAVTPTDAENPVDGVISVTNTASGCEGATITYDVVFSNPTIPDATLVYKIATADGTIPIADLSTIQGLGITVIQKITGMAGCEDVTTHYSNTIDISDIL